MEEKSEHPNAHEFRLTGTHHWFSEALYGKIVITALLIALEEGADQPMYVIEVLAISVLVLGLARAYVDVLVTHINRGRHMSFNDALRNVWQIFPIAIGLVVPVLVFLASEYGLMSLHTAFIAAKASALMLLFLFGMLLGTATGRKGLRRIMLAVLPTALGAAVIFIKALAH